LPAFAKASGFAEASGFAKATPDKSPDKSAGKAFSFLPRYTIAMGIELAPLHIGGIEISPPVVLAPLAGYTDLPYRLICRRLGAPYCSTEMMLDRQLMLPGKLRRRLIHLAEDDHPVAGQIVGNDPQQMATAAAELSAVGFDAVDLNFACPVRKVLARRRGGFMLKQPDLAGEIVRAVVAAAEGPVTVKLRMSFNAEVDSGDSFRRIAEGAFDAGAAAICLHARSVEQRYTGHADWEFLAGVKRHFHDKVIIGSGDVRDPASAVAMIEQTGVDGVAVARAAIGNPWFFRQLADLLAGRPEAAPTLAEQRELIRGHFDHAVEIYGPRRGPRIMRKFGIKYTRVHPAPARVRAAFVTVKTPADWQGVLDTFYANG